MGYDRRRIAVMTQYAGVTFEVYAADQFTRPDWEREHYDSSDHIPFSNRDHVQRSGLGNELITVPVVLSSDGAWAALKAAQGTTKRTLTDLFGQTYTGVMLRKARSPRRGWTQATIIAELTFEREAS